MKLTMNNKTQQGFTLIELLVVIAIIGILAAMVITNLRTARQKATDASAIASMSSARNEAEIWYDTNNLSYATLCTQTDFLRLLKAAESANGQTPACFASQTTYTASVQLMSQGGGQYFCIDGTGVGKKTNGPALIGSPDPAPCI